MMSLAVNFSVPMRLEATTGTWGRARGAGAGAGALTGVRAGTPHGRAIIVCVCGARGGCSAAMAGGPYTLARSCLQVVGSSLPCTLLPSSRSGLCTPACYPYTPPHTSCTPLPQPSRPPTHPPTHPHLPALSHSPTLPATHHVGPCMALHHARPVRVAVVRGVGRLAANGGGVEQDLCCGRVGSRGAGEV